MKKGKYFLLTFYFLVLANYAFAQKEDYVWYFGKDGAGLDFNSQSGNNSCEPTLLTNAAANNVFFEGAVSMCDRNTGQLLFYSDGVFIYDATHTQMAGNPGALWNTNSQNIIIPKPASNSIYYLISPEPQAACSGVNLFYPGMRYSIIDMTLNGGLGGIDTNLISLLDTSNCEKITAIRNSNGQNIWLVGHKYRSNMFFVFNVTSAGINTTPAYYSLGPIINTPQSGIAGINCFDAIGELKPSPNGRKLAFTTFYNGTSALFDFDNSTGVISNPIILNLGWTGYGVSFSPDNLKLYIGGGDSSTIMTTTYNGHLFQFDISSNDSAIINNSRTLIYTSPTSSYGSLKLGPNGKIYATLHTGNSAYGSTYLEVINYPDSLGFACGYVHNGFSLNGLYSSWGLNNIMETNNYCSGCNPTSPVISQFSDTLTVPSIYVTYQWFHDSIPINGATQNYYVASLSGNYNVVVTDTNGCTVGAGILNVIASVVALNNRGQFTIFPNPTENNFTIKNLSSIQKSLMEIFNPFGEIVYSEKFFGRNEYVVDANLAKGIYFVRVSDGEKNVVQKLIVE